ncbi:F-box protein At1g67340-like [Zingiber officinale]|uniref:MYND-type domain-containing protein n=1 Tax=Zingiber officinale TaxID=94328 RepID=A0A8J5I4J8_ZINOF|nr:F-box protein At1g67340-like [Zingiber officinale]KAG6535449.1 hypothetical protein ZIOFF_000422 [Zingiber officinale]
MEVGKENGLTHGRGASGGEGGCSGRKRPRAAESGDFFDGLPDELVVSILCKLSASAERPSDLISVLTVCKRLNRLGLDPAVLSKASADLLAVRANRWSVSSNRFLQRCADAGSPEACYMLGMILFYCLRNREGGVWLMAMAALKNHAAALFSLAVIHFNGSGKLKSDRNPKVGVLLCTRAASLCYVDAMRLLGYCFLDGHGVHRDVSEGNDYLLLANAREFSAFLHYSPSSPLRHTRRLRSLSEGLDLWRTTPPPEPHPANRFLVEWFATRSGDENGEGLGTCSNGGCGRPETRRHEFSMCSACGLARYCSRACQATHWKYSHKAECTPINQWLDAGIMADEAPLEGGAGGAELVLD